MTTFAHKFRSWQTLLLSVLIVLILYNLFSLTVFILKKYSESALIDIEPGIQFASFKPYLKNVPKVGYLTDKGVSREKISESFLQAQYYLAPTILEINTTEHPLAILDSENRDFIVESIKSLRAMRLSNNMYGQALLKRRGL